LSSSCQRGRLLCLVGHLRFDIAFALKKLRVRGAKMDEMQRKMAAEQIVAHLKLCGYTHPKGPRHVDE
jgi:hypothetical protein